MELVHYTHTLFLGGGTSDREYAWVEITPLQRWIWMLMGTGFIVLMVTDPPIHWDEIPGILLGSFMIVYVLFRNSVSSPNYLRFNNKGIRGRLADKGRVRWSWDQIRRIEYRPVRLILSTADSQTHVPFGHVDYRHRERVLDRLIETAREQNVEVEQE